MKSCFSIGLSFALAAAVSAAPRSSANYALTTEVLDAGGHPAASARYGSAGSLASFSATTTATAQTHRTGYLGQIYDRAGLAVTAAAPSIPENGTLQMGAWLVFDDATFLPLTASAVTWSVLAGPLASVSTDGVATAATVYQTSPATVRASYSGDFATLPISVLNVNVDDLGSYAADGLRTIGRCSISAWIIRSPLPTST